MTKCLAYYLILGLLSTGCVSEKTRNLGDHQTKRTISLDEKKLADETKLSKEIFILIGRGGCCTGHMISINKNGEVKYFVGTYSIPNDKWEMPEIYDSQKVTLISTYKPKDLELSQEKIKRLEELISIEENLHFKEDILVSDDYLYSLYLENKETASGYQSRKDKFPRNLKALIDLIQEEVELYELPGMA
ncbi:MAG: hypothetical protein IPM21_05975 [Acidobacteria bacterium]|nr:hypothetical protein [Acidobacteriota bacterium]